MKLEFILNIIKAIIKVEGLSKAVVKMGDLHGIFTSSGWTHLSIKITGIGFDRVHYMYFIQMNK